LRGKWGEGGKQGDDLWRWLVIKDTPILRRGIPQVPTILKDPNLLTTWSTETQTQGRCMTEGSLRLRSFSGGAQKKRKVSNRGPTGTIECPGILTEHTLRSKPRSQYKAEILLSSRRRITARHPQGGKRGRHSKEIELRGR